jgi:dolichol kinase
MEVMELNLPKASIVGYKFGATRWPSSSKTLEGTLGFILSVFLSQLFLDGFNNVLKVILVIISMYYDLIDFDISMLFVLYFLGYLKQCRIRMIISSYPSST